MIVEVFDELIGDVEQVIYVYVLLEVYWVGWWFGQIVLMIVEVIVVIVVKYNISIGIWVFMQVLWVILLFIFFQMIDKKFDGVVVGCKLIFQVVCDLVFLSVMSYYVDQVLDDDFEF